MIIDQNISSKGDFERFITKESFKKIFILTGKNSYFKSGAAKLIGIYFKNKNTKFYFKINSIPEISELKDITKNIKKFKPDLIVAVGGGSVMDYAKIANVMAQDAITNKSIINADYKLNKGFAKLAAIPTTAGSGAEVTANAVIYINSKKYSVEGSSIKPDYFFLIPQLLLNSSKKLKASSGFDAISQAIESIISTRSNKISLKHAKLSLNLSSKNYLNFVKKKSLSASNKMSLAAYYSGEAISISKTTAPHAISYPFTSYFGISHGHAVSLTLEKFLKFNYLNKSKSTCNFDLEKRYNIIFKILNVKNIFELESFLKSLKRNAQLEQSFKTLKINLKDDFPKIAGGVNLLRLKNNPVPLSKKDLKKILTEY
tara:strand:- start:13318 stop:14433 length:1116 start_codon:yes stop_codon:yes gene_type:complete